MSDLIRGLNESGARLVEQMIEQRREESLGLEFKTLNDCSGKSLPKSDKQLILKVVSGLANTTDGGVVIFGVQTEKQDDVDVATAANLIQDVHALRGKLASILPELLAPAHDGLSIQALPMSDSDASGFVAIHVPPSEMRPHMSVPHHAYFRRGSVGTVAMVHGEIRDLMLAPRRGSIALDYAFRPTGRSQYRLGVTIVFSLRNAGRAPVHSPFIRSHSSKLKPFEASSAVIQHRQSARGDHGFYGTRDAILHVGEHIDVCAFPTSLHVLNQRFNGDYLIREMRQGKHHDVFTINSQTPSPGQLIDDLPNFDFSFGAEDADCQSVHFEMDRLRMFDAIVGEHGF